ncbi:MAG: sigma-70 family RNA polymerase sigma factor [Caldilineaceae bacterium]|nr:sigma-70 family RNA polymerase sigma factor [Caldilineaceae bacterium]
MAYVEGKLGEEALVAQARAGDKNALAQLVEGHLQPIYRVALRMCGNVNDAEETLQETFLSAIKALPQFEGRAQFSTWLYRIASNTCLMRRRHQAVEPEMLPIDTAGDAGGDVAGDGGHDGDDAAPIFVPPRLLTDWSAQPVDVTLDHELRDQLQAAIAELPPTLRIVFIWRDLEGLSTTETAEIVGISESAVKVRLHRARLQLRESLASYFASQTTPSNPE